MRNAQHTGVPVLPKPHDLTLPPPLTSPSLRSPSAFPSMLSFSRHPFILSRLSCNAAFTTTKDYEASLNKQAADAQQNERVEDIAGPDALSPPGILLAH